MGGRSRRHAPGLAAPPKPVAADELVLVDTSVLIEVLRPGRPFDLERHVSLRHVCVCLPVIQEFLQGIREERFYRIAREALFAFQIVESPLTAGVFEEAAGLYRAARQRGLTVRSSTDCLIAACALRNNLTILHRDRDYPLIAQISALRQRTP